MAKSLRLEALTALKKCIEESIPELAGNICDGPSEPNHLIGTPSLAIYPISFEYQPNQAKPWKANGHSNLVVEVGKHEADVQLRLGAATHRQRVILEEKILQLFLEQELAPGILVTTIPACWDATVVWELEEEEWEDEKNFDKQWYTTISITGQLPALVNRRNVPTIEQIKLGWTEDFTKTHTESTFDTDESIEVFDID